VTEPYNPLDISNIGESITNALLQLEPVPLDDLPNRRFGGAGIYAIYYTGPFAPYALVTQANRNGKWGQPIYVGKAVPSGGRRGISVGTTTQALFDRLRQHRTSVIAATNLDLGDFHCRWLVIEPIWIPLGESLLINRFQPVWNGLVDGFGNHDPGAGRLKGMRSAWDVLHPGRTWADNLASRNQTPQSITQDALEYLRQRVDPTQFLR